jgi:hypothetical protein
MNNDIFPKFIEYVFANSHADAIAKSRYKAGQELTVRGERWIIDSVCCTQVSFDFFEIEGSCRLTSEDHLKLYGVTHV